MARLPEFLKEHGIDPKWFLEKAGSFGARAWRRQRIQGEREAPEYYIDAAFYWAVVDYPGSARWGELEAAWLERAPYERWLELEKVLGWLDPLEAELMEVNDG